MPNLFHQFRLLYLAKKLSMPKIWPSSFPVIKNLKFATLPVILGLFICFGPLYAQSVSLTSGGFPTVNGHSPATPVATQSTLGSALESHLNFGDVSAKSGRRLVRISIPVRISATTNYRLELYRTPFMGGSIQPQDIGFGILNARPQTGNNPKLADHATSLSIVGNFGANPSSAPFVKGAPRYPATFADLGESPTIVLTGVPTVAGGKLGENENSILVDLTFAVAPQYFTPGDLTAFSLSLVITPNP
jgi:hypothetical protein